MTEALVYLLDTRFGSKLYRQNVGVPFETISAPLLFCYGMDFIKSLTRERRYDMINAFLTSRYLDDLLDIDSACVRGFPMVPMVYQYRSRFYQWYQW